MNYEDGNGGLFNIIKYLADKGLNETFKTCNIAKDLKLNNHRVSRVLTILVKMQYLEKHYKHPYVWYTVNDAKKLYIYKFTMEVLKK